MAVFADDAVAAVFAWQQFVAVVCRRLGFVADLLLLDLTPAFGRNHSCYSMFAAIACVHHFLLLVLINRCCSQSDSSYQ